MGNKICVDKKPSPIDNLISFNPESLKQSEISNLSKQIKTNNNSYQHLNMWCLCENNVSNQSSPGYINKNNEEQIKSQNDNEQIKNELNGNFVNDEQKIIITPVELANIYKNHFLLDSQNVYILLLIFKKDGELDIENSPFPTGLWGIIESSSNMTPRGLLFAFPENQKSQNLESFLLSKRELNDSEFKYMIFIWNGKKSTAFLRSISLMKAFDLDKSLMFPSLVHYIYSGYYFNDNCKTPINSGYIFLGDVMNNTIENSEDTSNPSSDKINNFHETIYLFKLLYPNKKHKNKKQKNKNNVQNENRISPKDEQSKEKISNFNEYQNNNKQQNILFKGFNNEFLVGGTKKEFYDNFEEIEFTSSSNNNINIDEKNYYNGFSENFSSNNNNLEKSNLSNSVNMNKNAVMPPKLNLNINFGLANKINSRGSVDENSSSKRTISAPSKEDNKNYLNNLTKNINNKTNNINSEGQNQNNDIENNDDLLEVDEQDIDLVPINEALINKDKSSLRKIRIPKLMVSLQKNVLNEEKLTERAKIKSEQEENLNLLPESTLISTSKHIINKINNLGLNKINLSGIIKNNNINNLNNNNKNNQNLDYTDTINIKALNEDYNLKDNERKKIIYDYYSKHLSEVIPNFLYLSSYNAAKNKNLLEKYKITHILNCAADFCENIYEQENKYTYLSFYLKDHVLENIECIFYECIKFIENAKEKGGRVLVHCIQGISRSVTIVMAYLIFKNKFTYDKAFNIVQNKREISSPNFGFSIQLQNFYMRLYEPPSKFRYIPKIYAVGSFQNEQPDKIVCRLMNEPFYEYKENGLPRMLDKRGVFIIVSLTNVYLWIGSKISLTVKDLYLKTALEYINLLKDYEHAPLKENGPIYVYDGKENNEFINDLLKTKEKIERFKLKISDIFPEWNSWYKETKIEVKLNMKEKNNVGNANENNLDKNNNSNSNKIKKGFFVYPNEKPDAVLDFDDLNNETFLVACIYQKNKSKIYVWKGKFVDVSENLCKEYENRVKKTFFTRFNLSEEQYNKIESINEIPMEESDEFLSFI